MLETPTIDLTSYLNSKPAESAGGGKSFADNSSDFGNVLENVSKNYSENKTPAETSVKDNSQSSDNNKNMQPVSENQDKADETKYTDKQSADNKNGPDKIEDKQPENVQENSQSTESEEQIDDSPQEEEELVEESSTEAKEVLVETAKPQEKDNNPQPKPQIAEENKIENIGEKEDEVQKPENTAQVAAPQGVVEQVIAKVDSIVEKVLPQVGEEVKPEGKDKNTKVDSDKSKKDLNEDVNQTTKVLTPQINDTVDLALKVQVKTDSAQNTIVAAEVSQNIPNDQLKAVPANSENNTVERVSSQPQVQQQNLVQPQVQIQQNVVNVNAENNLTAKQVTQSPQTNAPAQIPGTAEADVQMPEVKGMVLSEVDINVDNTQVNRGVKDSSDKNSLMQDILAKTNVKITNIETSNSSNQSTNAQQNKQDTQDQIVKLALETNNKTAAPATEQTAAGSVTAAGLPEVTTEVNAQSNFVKALDSVQTQTQSNTQTHVTKQISENEILSQINSKLTNLKDEGMTKINMVLKPEGMGHLNLELVNSKEGLTAQITTNNVQVKEMLDKTIDTLKDNLSNQGINVNSVTVKVEETQKQQTGDMFSFENKSGQENQQQSDNAKNTNQGQNSLEEEVDNIITANFDSDEEPASGQMTEKVVSLSSGSGRVDYKV